MKHSFTSSMRVINLVLVTLLFYSFSITALAAKPEKCKPWPSCQNDDSGDDPLSLPYVVGIIDDPHLFNGLG